MANATSTQLQELYVAYFGRAADPTGLDYWTESGITTAAFAANMYAQPEFENEYGSKAVASQVNQIYKNLFDREADVDGLTYWTQQINLGNLQLAEIATHLIYAAQNNSGSEDDKTALTNRTNAAIAYTAKVKESAAAILAYTSLTTDPFVAGDNITEAKSYLSGIDKDTEYTAAGVAASVSTITANGLPAKAATHNLTVGIDDIDGGDGKDTFNAALSDSVMTLSSTDTVDGGSGVDSLNATISGTGTYSPTFTAIEKLYPTFTGAGTISLENITGVTLLSDTNSTANQAYTNIPSTSVDLGLSGNKAATTTSFTFTDAAVAGSSDSVDLALASAVGTITIPGVETLNISTSGGTSTLTGLTTAAATTLNITGDQNLTLGTLSATVATIAAADFTGDLTADGTNTTANTITGGSGNDTITGQAAADDVLTGGAGNDTLTPGTGDNTIAGGAGNDTIVMADGLTSADTITGGDGTDTVTISTVVTVANGANVSGVEVLELSGTTAITQDLDAFDGVTAVTFGSSNNTVYIVNDAPAGTTLDIEATSTGLTDALNLKSDTSSDSTTVTMGTSSAGFTRAALTVNDFETLNFHSKGGANVITDLNANDVTTINVSGTKAFTVTDELDGSTSVTAVTVTNTADTDIDVGSNTVDVTMTGAGGNDSLKGGTTNDTISGGAGNDTLTGGNGNDDLTGGTGNDTLDGGAGNDTLTGGEGNDTITAGTGNDTITGGAGNDTINFTTDGDITKNDSVDGGAGTDTVDIDTDSSLTGSSKVTLTNVEKVILEASNNGGAFATFDASGIASLSTLTLSADSDDAAYSVTNLPDGATVESKANTNATALTLDTAGTSLTLKAAGDSTATVTISDATTLAITAGTAATNDIAALVLDDDATTTLTLTGSTTDGADLLTGNITGSNLLSSLTATTTTTGGLITVGTVVDGDALTSIVANADYGNISFGAIAGTGTAEGLATFTATADNGATTTFGAITADTTDSTADVTTTLTGTASTAGSTVALGSLTSTYGIVNGTLSGPGSVASTLISAEHIDLTISTGTSSTHADLVSSDDAVITSSGSGALILSDLNIADDLTLTHSGSGALTISAIDAGIGDFTLDGSAASGAITISANSATSTSEGHVLTGGSGNDTLLGAAANDTLTGGAGDDSLTGGTRNDTLDGGAGNDTLVPGAGTDTVTGGAGNDTITLSTNWSSSDSFDGGAGTDTVTLDVTTTIAPTFTNIENATVGFTTGGAFNAGNSSSISKVTIEEATDATDASAVVINLPTGTEVLITDAGGGDAADVTDATVDTVTGASLTVTGKSAMSGALTITDAVNVTLNATSTGVTTSFGSVVVDDSDTTSLTIAGADTAFTFGTGAITGTDKVTTITGTTTTTTGALTIGAVVDANSLTSLVLNGDNANLSIGAIGASDNGELLETITLTAAGGATTSTGAMTLDSVDSTTDLTTTITMTAESSSTATLGAITSTYGKINLTASGAGAINVGSETVNQTYGAASTFDLTGATGTNYVNVVGAGATSTISLASETGTDTIGLDGGASTVITNFQTGASKDTISIDVSAFGSNTVAGDDSVPANSELVEVSSATNISTGSVATLTVLTGAHFATTGLVETAVEAGGSHALSVVNTNTTDDLLIAWSDGTNSYIGSLDIGEANATAGTIAATVSTMTTWVELSGVDVSTAGTLVNGNYDIF